MSTIFIAVQCCQCSTMQVKQKKKSSNKWNCVICNEKQSVRKIFAQGCLAKDVRKFVQSFNMSRQFSETLTSQLEEIDDTSPNNNSSSYQRKRRSDWTEYLESEDKDDHRVEEEDEQQQQQQQHRGGGFEPEIVTELPKEMFKKPKLRNYSAGLNKPEGNKPFNPIFSKRKTNDPIISEENKDPKKFQGTMAQGASKWNDYLTQDDDEFMFEGGGCVPDPIDPWSQGVLKTQFNDQRVEDDVHPEFK